MAERRGARRTTAAHVCGVAVRSPERGGRERRECVCVCMRPGTMVGCSVAGGVRSMVCGANGSACIIFSTCDSQTRQSDHSQCYADAPTSHEGQKRTAYPAPCMWATMPTRTQCSNQGNATQRVRRARHAGKTRTPSYGGCAASRGSSTARQPPIIAMVPMPIACVIFAPSACAAHANTGCRGRRPRLGGGAAKRAPSSAHRKKCLPSSAPCAPSGHHHTDRSTRPWRCT